jgi:hypothetical protein
VFVGGRSGVGKSSVGHEMHAPLSAARVPGWVHRVATDDQSAADITAEVILLAGRIAS